MSFPRATPSVQSPFQPSQPSTTLTVPFASFGPTSSSSARARAAWERGRVRRGQETARTIENRGELEVEIVTSRLTRLMSPPMSRRSLKLRMPAGWRPTVGNGATLQAPAAPAVPAVSSAVVAPAAALPAPTSAVPPPPLLPTAPQPPPSIPQPLALPTLFPPSATVMAPRTGYLETAQRALNPPRAARRRYRSSVRRGGAQVIDSAMRQRRSWYYDSEAARRAWGW